MSLQLTLVIDDKINNGNIETKLQLFGIKTLQSPIPVDFQYNFITVPIINPFEIENSEL